MQMENLKTKTHPSPHLLDSKSVLVTWLTLQISELCKSHSIHGMFLTVITVNSQDSLKAISLSSIRIHLQANNSKKELQSSQLGSRVQSGWSTGTVLRFRMKIGQGVQTWRARSFWQEQKSVLHKLDYIYVLCRFRDYWSVHSLSKQ